MSATHSLPKAVIPGNEARELRSVSELAADADVAAGGAVVAAVAPDERAVAALGAGRAGEHRSAALVGRLEDAHLAARHAVLAEDAEHGVAVHDETREVGNRRGEGLLLARLIVHRY